jgi:hypothetical protein
MVQGVPPDRCDLSVSIDCYALYVPSSHGGLGILLVVVLLCSS